MLTYPLSYLIKISFKIYLVYLLDTYSDSWRTQFQALESSVAPFREQLDKYNAERETLLQERAMTQKVRYEL